MMLATPSLADTVFGPETFQRGKGKPATVTTSFSVPNAVTNPILRIQVDQIASAVITLNGTQVFGPSHFNRTVTLLETPVNLLSENELGVELRGKPGGSITVEITADAAGPPRAVATIPPEGGQVSLPGFATVTFPAGAFATSQEVELSATSDPNTSEIYSVSGVIFAAGPRVSYEIRVNTHAVAPTTSFDVIFNVPPEFLPQIPATHEPAVYVQIRSEGESEVLDFFEIFFSTFSPSNGEVTTTLPAYALTDLRTADNSFESVMVLGAAPIRPVITDAPEYSCETHQDPHKILAPPVDGQLVVTGAFLEVRKGGVHLGTDYATRDEQGLPVEGLPVRALQDGKIGDMGFQLYEPQSRACKKDGIPRTVATGFGQWVVVEHTDGSRSLHAHLQQNSITKVDGTPLSKGDVVTKDEIIARSGSTGTYNEDTCTGAPHLHVAFVPSGAPPQFQVSNPWKVDVHRCIGRNLYVANARNFSTSAGLVSDYNVTTDFSLFHHQAGLPEFETRAVAAFNRSRYVTGSQTVTLDGIAKQTFAGAATGIDTNRSGVYISENFLDLNGGFGTDAKIHAFDHTLTVETGGFVVLGLASNRVLAVNDNRVADVDVSKARIFDLTGDLINEIPGVFFAAAAVRDRMYLAHHVIDQSAPFNQGAVINVYDLNGQLTTTAATVSSRVFGLAASEKHLYISASDLGQVLVFDRTVARDNNGQIVTDSYSPSPTKTLVEAGFPMGLAVE